MGNVSPLPDETRMETGPNATEGIAESGWRVNLDRDLDVMPSTRVCWYCSTEGKTHPLEHFVCYPCCGYKICRDCMRKPKIAESCGECITIIPQGNVNALPWIRERLQSNVMGKDEHLHLLGRIFVMGCHLFLDELISMPLYERLQPPCMVLAMMNPPNVQVGVHYLEEAAKRGVIAAMLDLAHVYNTSFNNDPFQKDKKKAEYWFQRAIGQGNRTFPLALTCYGEFLTWEKSRHAEARNMFQLAAESGHARGQYEYAMCLLGAIGEDKKDEENEESVCRNDETVEAIKWLCRASEHGHHVPSYVRLVKLLIEIFEKEYGTACLSGMSPLPRALQILSLVEDGQHGNSESVRKEAAEILDRYDGCKTRCANCGDTGSKNNPLSHCATCGVVAYCSRICARRDFRDGHKFDCCSQTKLFDFHLIKTSLPWTKGLRQEWESGQPLLQETHRRTLMQLVEDDTDEVYGEQEMEYDEHLLTQLMLRMRINLETYLERSLKNLELHGDNHALQSSEVKEDNARNYNLNLKKRIDAFAKYSTADQDFINAMHKIREYGNIAAHRLSDGPKLIQKACQDAVCDYRSHKEKYEINQSRSLPGEEDPPSSTPGIGQRKNANAAGGLPPDQLDNKNAGDKLSSGTRNTAVTTLISQPQRITAPTKQQKKKKKKKKRK